LSRLRPTQGCDARRRKRRRRRRRRRRRIVKIHKLERVFKKICI
jgi:hypothetical protein